MFPLIFLPIITTAITFRLDGLKDPHAFWNTRPIRPRVMHTTKFIFLHLVFTLPLVLGTLIVSLNATSLGDSLLYATEAALWCIAAIHLIGFAALHDHRWSHLLLVPALGLLGLMLMSIITSKFAPEVLMTSNNEQIVTNIFIVLAVIGLLFLIAGIAQIKKPHFKFPLWAPLLVGVCTFSLIVADWLPRIDTADEVLELKEDTAITEFSTTRLTRNQRPYYRLEFPIENFLSGSDQIPIDLLNRRVEVTSSPSFETLARYSIGELNFGPDFSNELNLGKMVSSHARAAEIRVYVEIPVNRSVSSSLKFDQLPRKNVTLEGEYFLSTVSFDDFIVNALGEPLDYDTPGNSFSYKPSIIPGGAGSVFTKVFQLPLLSSELLVGRGTYRDPILIMRHRETHQWFHIENNGGHTRHGLFGIVRQDGLRNSENSSMVSHHWEHRLQREYPDFPDYQEWKKEAEMLFLPKSLQKIVKVPFQVTIAVPDLDLMQKLLNEDAE